MNTYGLIGYPLAHSFSKTFFTEKFEKEGLDAEYLNFELTAIDQLPAMLEQYPTLQGFNVTIPYKCQIIPYLDDLTEEAREIGAVNVVRVVHQNGRCRLKGFNSDAVGFRDSIQPLLKSHHRKALILGTGGASRAVDYALKKMGLTTTFVSRSPREHMLSYTNLPPQVMEEHTVIVNCSPVGMYPHLDTAPAIPYTLLTPRHLLFDLVYNPSITLFMGMGHLYGAQVCNGLQMLHLQALSAWEFWNCKGSCLL